MFRARHVALVSAIALTAGLVALGAGGASAAEAPTATEVGVTPTEIHIAVVADVDSPLAPNVFKGSVDGVQAFAKYANAHGGIAGRKVVVDFYDSKLNPNETRNSIIKACQNDLAMVGTSAVFLSNIDDMNGLQGFDRRRHRPSRSPVHVVDCQSAVLSRNLSASRLRTSSAQRRMSTRRPIRPPLAGATTTKRSSARTCTVRTSSRPMRRAPTTPSS